MGFVEASKALFVRCFDYRGRSSRSEFWYAMLFSFLASLVTSIVDSVIRQQLLAPLLNLALFLPSLSLQVRRLHDIDRTGWWIAAFPSTCLLTIIISLATIRTHHTSSTFSLIPLLGFVLGLGFLITLLVWFCTDSSHGPNRFGPHPRTIPRDGRAPRPSFG